jgi:hypothetical protein
VASCALSLGLSVERETKDQWQFNEQENRGDYFPVETGNFLVTMRGVPDHDAIGLLRAACRKAEPDVLAIHLGNLALHKRIVKLGGEGVAALVQDYARLLANYSEMAIVDAITKIKTTDESPYFPQLATLIKLIEPRDEMYHQALQRAEAALRNSPQIEQRDPSAKYSCDVDKRDLPKTSWKAHHWQEHVAEAEKMLSIAKASPSLFNADEWTKIVADRRNEAIISGFDGGVS